MLIIFCEYSEILQKIHQEISTQKIGIDATIEDIWMREYQMKKDRIHPLNMIEPAHSGYIFHCYKIIA